MNKAIILLALPLAIINAQIGRVETVGYTTYDRQYGGPTYTWCRTDPVSNGIHVYWVYSNFNPATDRNQRYNFYDFIIRSWDWTEGINVFPQRSGFGNIDYDPLTGNMIGITHQTIGGIITPVLARGLSPHSLFEYSVGPAGYQWPAISVSQNRAIHCAMIDGASQDSLWYSRIQPWAMWSTPINITLPAPPPAYPNYNIHASKRSNKVIILWHVWADVRRQRAFYRLSNDGGINWEPSTQIPFPPSSGLVPSYHISSLFAMFDNQDNLHIVTSVSDTGRTMPAEIWHYCPSNTPNWSLIHHYDAETLAAGVGYNALFATRPSIVQNPTNNYLYAVWEQFDSLNYEPTTHVARADIYIAESPDYGLSWRNRTRITTPNTTSKRFPCAGGVVADTLILAYLIDSIAGLEIYTQGRATRNPIACHRIPLSLLKIEEPSSIKITNNTLDIKPNPFSTLTTIRYSLPAQTNATLSIYDVSGRLVKTLSAVSGSRSVDTTLDGSRDPYRAQSQVIWNGKGDNNKLLPKGVYFIGLKTSENQMIKKIVLLP